MTAGSLKTEVTHAPSASPMTTANAAKPAAVSSPLAPHEALKDGNTCPSALALPLPYLGHLQIL